MGSRIGVDIGGTFTDLIYYDDAGGKTRVAKVLTTPARPEEGCLSAVRQTLSRDELAAAEYFLHGTTVGLNALLERRGAKVGLLATRGFRDILEIRRGDRAEMYNLCWSAPPPLVPRHLRLPVSERMRADGIAHLRLAPEDVRAAAETFLAEGVTSVAIAFLNAYANPAHELEAAELLRQAGYEGPISLSHQVSGEYREYERTTTTVIDAFVRARMASYLRRLADGLASEGFRGEILVTRSGGGSMTLSEAEARPFETIMSGPVAGAEGAGELSRRCALGDLVTADVGGTSFDACLITDGRPQLMYQGEIIGLPVQTPWVDVRSIGAGGGSIASADKGGLLRVGPESAGAVPGPACYGRGGTLPTVTDAALVLGMLGRGRLASGLALDVETARNALAPVASALRLSVEETARGVLAIVAANMANTIREITVDQGVDPRQLSILAFGGAGPLVGCLLARELSITRVVVPPHAGNFSAWGLLGADLTRSGARTKIMRVGPETLTIANGALEDLYSELFARGGEPSSGDVWSRETRLDMRYTGQEHTLTVHPEQCDGQITASAQQLVEQFVRDYQRAYGVEMEAGVEIVSVRATIRQALPRREESRASTDLLANSDAEVWQAYSFVKRRETPFQIVDRAALAVGERLMGPAIITEPTTTTYLDAGFSVTREASGCLILTDEDATNDH